MKVKDGLTIFFTTHILTEAEYICDEVAIINKGRIIAVDSPDDLKKRFGSKKTIKIHLAQVNEKLKNLFNDVKDYKIDFNSGTNITIISDESEVVLMKVLQILNSNNITIEDLSAMPTNLEEIFLKVVNESNESDT
jgi:ABC-2 type transport system ATP-binding protein